MSGVTAYAAERRARNAVSAEMSADVLGRALLEHVGRIAADVGRLRRRFAANDYDAFLFDRLAACVDAVDAMLRPTASDLVSAGVSVDAALRTVDERAMQLRSLSGEAR